ncbi:MAG TPA: SGNH/GDSL hydrolase family protein, partial [Acidimicrobiales bacterium]|nr:SGNH/GDSL hydrolase family protein [Acidimicrobiales bacterium]
LAMLAPWTATRVEAVRLPSWTLPAGLVPSAAVVPPGSGPVRAVALGDSITVVSESSIVASSGDVAEWSFRAHDNYRTDQVAPWLPGALATHPDLVVIDLGTNDALQNDSHAVGELAAVAAEISAAKVPCVAWTTVSEVPDLRAGDGVASEVNAFVESLPASHPGWQVEDWWSVSHADPSAMLSPADGVHPTAAGQAWLGRAYAGLAAACALRLDEAASAPSSF